MKNIFEVLLAVLIFFFSTSSAFAESVEAIKQTIIKQSVSMGVDPAIMLSIAKTESGFRQNAKGASGTVGVFQLSPSTARNMGLDPYKLEDNVKGGIIYYQSMYKRFGSMELAVAAYNTGPDAIKRCNYTVPNHAKGFVSRIMTDYDNFKKQI